MTNKTAFERKIRGSISTPREPLVNLSMTRTQAIRVRSILVNTLTTEDAEAAQTATDIVRVLNGILK